MDLKTLSITLWTGGKAFIFSFVTGLFALGLYSIAIDDQVIYAARAVLLIEAMAVFIGGYYAGLSAGSVGWVHGGLAAAVALIIVSLVKGFVFGTAPVVDSGTLAGTAGLILLGSLGGIAGINLGYAKRIRIRKSYLGL